MQIVIDIPDGCYKELNNGQFPIQDAYRLVAWIKEGTPLPKGHGRLIDADKLLTEINTWCDCKEGICLIKDASTILEAQREKRR